jgi:hypothetical protein
VAGVQSYSGLLVQAELGAVVGGGATKPPQASVSAAGAALGTITELPSGGMSAGKIDPLRGYLSAEEATAAGRVERYALQAVAREALPGHRVGACLRWVHGGSGPKKRGRGRPVARGVEVWRKVGERKAFYGGLMTCGSVFVCPPCAAKIAERRRVELEQAISNHRVAGGGVLIAAFTFSHSRADVLALILGAMLEAFKGFKSGRAWVALVEGWGLVGDIRAVEVTWSVQNGWHPHLHVLWFTQCPLGPEDVASLEEDFSARWRVVLAREGLRASGAHGCRVQATYGAVADYVAKFGYESERELPWGVTAELVKSHAKRGRRKHLTPFDLLRQALASPDQAPRFLALFKEYVAAFKGTTQLKWSRDLREKVLPDTEEVSDAEIAARLEAPAERLGRLSLDDWRRVLHANQRAELLRVAELGEWPDVLAFVAALPGVPGGREPRVSVWEINRR